MITAFGKTYETTAAATARIAVLHSLNETWGESDDRVTEINALREGIAIWEAAQAEGMTEPVYEVVKNEYEVPCEHPACPVMHAHLDNVTFDHAEWVEYTVLQTGEQKRVWKRTGHLKTNIEWVIVKDGERAPESGLDEAFDTKRDAVAALRQRGLL